MRRVGVLTVIRDLLLLDRGLPLQGVLEEREIVSVQELHAGGEVIGCDGDLGALRHPDEARW